MMRHMVWALISALSLVPMAWAQEEESIKKDGLQPYLGVYGGVAFPESIENVRLSGSLNGVNLSAASVGDLKLRTGSIFGAKLGLFGHDRDQLWRWLGAEVDLSYTSTGLRSQPIRVSGLGGNVLVQLPQTDLNVLTGALHVLAKWPDGPVQPFVGAGPAIVHASISSPSAFVSGSATTIGLSAVGGVRFKFNEQVGAFVEYKHIRAAIDYQDIQGDAVIHAAVVGFNLLF